MSQHFDFGAFDAADASYPADDAGSGYGGADYFGVSGASAYPPYAASLNGQSTDVAQAPPLQVTHVGPTLLRAGVEIWLQALIRFLDPRRVRIVRCLVTMPKQIDPRLARELGVPVEIGDRQSVRLAARASDVILCWGPCELGHWLADCRPKLCVFVAHGEGYWTRHMLQACAPVIDHVVVVSRRVEERLGTSLPVTQIGNGVDASRLGLTRPRRRVREALGFEADDFVLGYVGRFSDEKRPHLLVEAVARLPARYKALFVGWGPLRASLMERANDRIPGRYAFATAVNDCGDYYAALDALCLPSAEEGYALVILEAMMCGRPVIATPVGCVPEIIRDRVNGLIVSGTPESIAKAAELLHDHPAWACGMATEGKSYADEHGHARTMARDYEDLLLRLYSERALANSRYPMM